MASQPVADFSDVSQQFFVVYEADFAGQLLIAQFAKNHLLLRRKDVVDLGVCSYRGRVTVLSGGDNVTDGYAEQKQQGRSYFVLQDATLRKE